MTTGVGRPESVETIEKDRKEWERKEVAKEMRTEEKEIKRWDRQEQAHILKNTSKREAEIENTQKRKVSKGIGRDSGFKWPD